MEKILSTTDQALPDFISNQAKAAAKAVHADQITLTFDDNGRARDLFGQYDENLALLERELNLQAVTRGNKVTLIGSATVTDQARRILETLYGRLSAGETITAADVEGAIQNTRTADAQPEKANAGKSRGEISTSKKAIHARTPNQSAYICAMESSELIFGTGPAGTGKTYLAVAYAASLLERGAVDRIILSRPAVEAGERLGFLPGDMKDKVDPYLRPLYDALYDMMPGDQVERAITNGVIEIAPLAFMRGRTLAHSAIILDEAQNTTSMQMKMFLTRLGEGSKMIITGDPSQVDLPNGQTSGLAEALNLLETVKGIETVRFTSKDVVRHKLVARIVDAYDKADGKSFAGRKD
ncbi:MAG: phosphate starvation-inducible protein PhoH [Hyphomicrobiales bacterium]|nr:MAG: phosphate starvation-inducible protein PhoH [Hyphomicrobiales bacterium]